nr:copia protein [Tanacetum cinerariifolium]
MFACFLFQEEPKRVHQALKDTSWIEAIQEELLQFKMQKEEGIDYEEVFDPVARIEAIRLFLAYVSFMGFMVYQMDVKSDFLYRTIKEEKQDGIFISQDKYVAKILRKFALTDGKSASTPIDTEKPLLKDPDGEDVDVHVYSNYAGASLDRKSTTRGCQFLGCILISWQCKKQTVVATSSTKAKYVAAASCCAQVLWIQNSPNASEGFEQILDFLNANVIQYALTVIGEEEEVESFRIEKIEEDSSLKFYMYPRFLQLMIDAQVGDLSSHTTKYTSPALTQKVFTNMRRVGKGFFEVDTPLFKGMLVPQQAADDVANVAANDVDDFVADVAELTPPSPTPAITPQPSQELPSTSQVTPTLPPSPIA